MIRHRPICDPQAPRLIPHPGEAIPNAPEWMGDALCASIDADLWFPDAGESGISRQARAICRQCPVQTQCLSYALDAPANECGIWGGTTEKQRALIRAEKKAAS